MKGTELNFDIETYYLRCKRYYELFCIDYKLSGSDFSLDAIVLHEAISRACRDLQGIVDRHEGIKLIDQPKIAGYLAGWLSLLKPISIIKQDARLADPYFVHQVNEYFALEIAMITLMAESKNTHKNINLKYIEKEKKWKRFFDFVRYVMRYRSAPGYNLGMVFYLLEEWLEAESKSLAMLDGAKVVVDEKNEYDDAHCDRVCKYVEIMLNAIIESGIYADEMKELDIRSAVSAAKWHDIGKLMVSKSILGKSSELTDDELEKVEKHTIEGEKIISCNMGDDGNLEMEYAAIMAINHHENWDGSGYPNRKRSLDIHILGRVVAIADVYDALVSARPYKEAFTHKKAVEIIKENKPKRKGNMQFDPELVKVFLGVADEFRRISGK